MAHVIEITNPFQPDKDAKTHLVAGAPTVREWLGIRFPGFVEFDRPTICLFNGKPLKRKEWETARIQGDDLVTFAAVPGMVAVYIIYAILVIASIAISLSIKAPSAAIVAGQDSNQADPVYTLKGQRNQIKLGDVIEVPYGRCRLYPSYAAVPYNKYQNNDQYLYQLFCLGQGRFNIHSKQIEDTDISNFDDVQIEIVEPGQSVTLFPDNVITSPEVGTIELLDPSAYVVDVPEEGHNEDNGNGGQTWVVDVPEQGHWVYDYAGPFVANASGTKTNRIEVDIVLPKGLYYSNNSGGLDNLTASAGFDARMIDDAGAPLGDWFQIGSFNKTLKTTTPQRFTIGAAVAEGRYEIRGYRTNTKNTNSRAGNDLSWETLRAYLPATRTYGNVTVIAMKAKATNNLNSNAQTRFNVWATRLLPVWNLTTGTWDLDVETRSPVWAFVDIFRAKYGAQLANRFLELDYLCELADLYADREEFFDWVYDQPVTAWEASKLAARVGRGIPMLNGSRVTISRDAPKDLPSAIFNPDNIIAGSFRWEIKLPSFDAYDGLEVAYVDPDTWKEETVKCLLPKGEGKEAGDNCKQTKACGITGRTHAFRVGMYERALEKYTRENIIFKTGLEGHIPSYGELIAVSHDIPRWSTGGLLQAVNGLVLTLSEKVVFEEGQTHKIVLRKKNGEATQPLDVTPGVDEYHVSLVAPLDPDDFSFDYHNEQPIYLFGKTSMWGKPCRVVNLQPSDEDTVEVTAVNYTELPFIFDEYDAPELDNNGIGLPSIPALPSVSGLRVTKAANLLNTVIAAWKPSAGAKYYVVQISYNNTDWEYLGQTVDSWLQFAVLPRYIYVRVSAVNLGAGLWATWQGQAPVEKSTVVIDDGETPAGVSDVLFEPDLNTITAGWIPPVNTAIKFVHIYKSLTTVRPVDVTFSIAPPQKTFVFAGLAEKTKYYFWFEAEAINGRHGPISEMYSSETGSDPVSNALNELAKTLAQSLANSSDHASAILQEIEDREAGIAELNTALADKASVAALTSESQTRATNDASETSAREVAISALSTTVQQVGAALATEQTTRATNDTAETNAREQAISAVQSALNGKASQAALDSESSTRATADSAETTARNTAISTLTNTVNGKASQAALDSESTTRATNDATETTQRTTAIATLQTQVDGKATQAALDSESSTRATADAAETSQRTTAVANLQTQVDAKASQAYVDNLIATRVTETSALARTIANLMATMGETSAYVQTLADAYVDSAGNAVARWATMLTAASNGDLVQTGIEMVAQNGAAPISAIRMLASVFQLRSTINGVDVYPFQVVDGVVRMNTAIIADATITSAMIQSLAANKVSATSLSAITATIGLLRTAASGARTEIEDNQIRVYDGAGTLRVRMGIW